MIHECTEIEIDALGLVQPCRDHRPNQRVAPKLEKIIRAPDAVEIEGLRPNSRHEGFGVGLRRPASRFLRQRGNPVTERGAVDLAVCRPRQRIDEHKQRGNEMPRHEGARRGAQSRRRRRKACHRDDIGHEVGFAIGPGSGNHSELGDARPCSQDRSQPPRYRRADRESCAWRPCVQPARSFLRHRSTPSLHRESRACRPGPGKSIWLSAQDRANNPQRDKAAATTACRSSQRGTRVPSRR